MRKILLRFDDVCPTMNWETFNQAVDVMSKANVVALLGVIPECRDTKLMVDNPRADFWSYIKSLQSRGYSIAMHGTYHVYDSQKRGLVSDRYQSEFAGHSYEKQYERIKHGKEILEKNGIKTDIFFAPSHSYDRNTLKALYANGFKYISDGCSAKPYLLEGIRCIPCRSFSFPVFKTDGYYTCVMHSNTWGENKGKYGYSRFIETCDNNADEIVDFYEFAKLNDGNLTGQLINEKFYIWKRRVREGLSRLKRKLIS